MACPNATYSPMPEVKPSPVRYSGIDQDISVYKPRKTILDISLKHKIPSLHESGGSGRYSIRRQQINRRTKNMSPLTLVELAMKDQRRMESTNRLGCQSRANDDDKPEQLIWTNKEVQKKQTELFPEGKAEEKAIAILFCDLRNFTKISTQHFALDMANMLNRFYTIMGEPILMNNGIIYQYVGDEIVGIFGATGGSREKICMDAVRAAFGMSCAMERLNQEELSSFGTSLQIGIGIHFGKAFIGHLGHPQFRQFSVVGLPVNIASRIQGYTRPSKTNMLISDTVASAIPGHVMKTGKKFKPELKGLGDSLELIEILGFEGIDMQLELQTSLHGLLRDQDGFAASFYKNLYNKDPSLRHLFKSNLVNQGRMLTHMLMDIVYSLSRPEFLSTGLEALGRNHARYGVKMSHYHKAHEAFMETIELTLGENATPKVLKSWDMALSLIIDSMKRGAN